MKNRIYSQHYRRNANRICTFFIALFFLCIIYAVALSVAIPATADESAAQKDSRCKYYKSIVIEKGDTLWTIADQYISEEYSSKPDYIDEVKHMNNLVSDEIHAGNYLVIPYYGAAHE